MREADQLKNDALEVILSGCHQRVLRPGQPAYQSLNEIGCIAEMVHKALARTLKVDPPKSLDSWRSMLPQHGLQCPSSITHLHHSYGWRNKCSHDDFDKEYFDLDTVDGLVAFCQAECLNPHKIPALVVTRHDHATNAYVPLSASGATEAAVDGTRLGPVLGLQPDYAGPSRGTLTPAMITAVFQEARRAS